MLRLSPLFSPSASLLYIRVIDWFVSASLSLSLFLLFLLLSPSLAVAAGESRQRLLCEAFPERRGGKKSTGRAADERNKGAEGRKLKRGQRRRKRGQQWARQGECSGCSSSWISPTHIHTHTHKQGELLIKFSCSAVAIHSLLQAEGGCHMQTPPCQTHIHKHSIQTNMAALLMKHSVLENFQDPIYENSFYLWRVFIGWEEMAVTVFSDDLIQHDRPLSKILV